MSRQIQIRRGSATDHENFTGAVGEVTMDTTNKTLRVHDGTTAGGIPLARMSDIPSVPDVTSIAMPSNTYDDLTLGATDSTYTAPGDGYFTWHKTTGNSSQYFGMINTTAGNLMTVQWVPIRGGGCQGFLPAKTGDVCRVIYTASGTTECFRFIYAVSVGS